MPVPTCEVMCSGNCCTRKYIPLDLAFARTIHRFQGLSAGPVDEGKIKNMYECIICDPDGQHAETRATGLLYTALSRATTFGDEDGLNSAIYFMGQDLTTERIQEVTRTPRAKHELINVTRRRAWVHRLETAAAKQRKTNTSTKKFKELMSWASTTRYTYDELYTRTTQYVNAKRNKQM